MLQAANLGLEFSESSPWQDRFQDTFQRALTRRLNSDQQKRRERLEVSIFVFFVYVCVLFFNGIVF